MKFIDLKPLSIARLKAYRRSVMAKISGYETCDCGVSDCDNAMEMNKNNPNYINLRAVWERINKELAHKQQIEFKASKNTANVPTIAEQKRKKLHQ